MDTIMIWSICMDMTVFMEENMFTEKDIFTEKAMSTAIWRNTATARLMSIPIPMRQQLMLTVRKKHTRTNTTIITSTVE